MISVDSTVMNVALPSIQDDLGFRPASLAWVVNAYSLAYGGLLLLGGRLADHRGRRRMFIIGAWIFGIASLVGGLAPTATLLVLMRALQGIGAALMTPAALSLLAVVFPEGPRRTRALGVWGAVGGLGSALGLLLGGVLTLISWRWAMLINVPVVVAVLVAAPLFLPEAIGEKKHRIDFPGAVAVTTGVALLVYALIRAAEVGWTSAQTLVTLVAALLLIIAFAVIQAGTASPLVPLRLFRNPRLVGASIAELCAGAGLFGMFFFVSLFLQQIRGFSPLDTGFAFLPAALCVPVGAQVASRLLGRLGHRVVIAGGLAVAAAGTLLLARVSPEAQYADTVLPALVVVAFGMGVAFVGLTSAAVDSVSEPDVGLASAMLQTALQIGGALGLAVLASVAVARSQAVASLDASVASAAATTAGYVWAFLAGAGILALGALIAALLVQQRASSNRDGDEPIELEPLDLLKAQERALWPHESGEANDRSGGLGDKGGF